MSDSTKPLFVLRIQRLVLSGLIAAHGWARLLTSSVDPFGDWLNSQGIPYGLLVAYAVTALEIIGSILLAVGLKVRWLSVSFALLYTVGMILVHAPAGWFVVGLGRNGMEYSVLLIVCLLSQAWVAKQTDR